jgi:serine O-acetyltransferase
MEISLSLSDLTEYLKKQLENIFPDGGSLNLLNEVVPEAIRKIEYCFSHTNYPLNWKEGKVFFNHLNADQYIIFIYFCSNITFVKFTDVSLATKLFYLNKVLHSFHCMYDTSLPNIFLVIHGGGVVLGKATYADYFIVTQGCTVGANPKFEKPNLGKYLFMYPNSSIVGKTHIGNNVCISHGSFVNNEVIESDSLVVGKSPELLIKFNDPKRMANFFMHSI